MTVDMRFIAMIGCTLAISCGGGGAAAIDAPPVDTAQIDAPPVSGANDLTAFALRADDNPGLAADVVATTSGTTITASLPFVDVAALRATFITTGA